MIVVTGAGGTQEDCAIYRRIIEAQTRKCAEYGYQHLVFDLGGLGTGEPFPIDAGDFAPQVNGDSLPAATFKAPLVQRAFLRAKVDEVICWLDADCIPFQRFNPLVSFEGVDAAVTLRPIPEIGLSNNPALDFLNSGVVWIRNNEAGRRFCGQWARLSHLHNTDQGALNDTAGWHMDVKDWAAAMRNVIHGFGESRVLVLDCAEWNNWHPPFTGARIAHLKRGIRNQAVDYL